MKRRPTVRFRLFVAGDTVNSTQALTNLTAICEAHLTGRYEIEVVDVFHEPKRALQEGILMTPTLVTVAPAPVRRLIGTLGDTELVLQALGLEPPSA